MALVANTFQGENGTNLTAVTSGGVSGSPYQIVNPSNTDAVEYSSVYVNPITTTSSTGKFDAALNTASNIGEVRFVRTGAVGGAQQAVIKFTGAPSSTCVLIQSRGTIQNGDIRVSSTGVIHASLSDGTYALSGGTPIDMSLGSPWYVIDFWIQEGTTSTNGRVKFRVRALNDLSTVLYSADSGTTRNTGIQGTDEITDWRIGKFTSAATMPPFYVAQHRADDGATDYIADPTVAIVDEDGGTSGTVYRHTFEGWSNNQTITTGGSGSGTPFTEVPATNGATVIATSTAAVHGSRGVSITAPEAAIAGPGWINLDTPQISASAILTIPSYPTSVQRMINTYLSGGGSGSPHLDLLTDGRVRIQGASHATVYTSSNVIPLNVPVEYQVYFKSGATTIDGTVRVRIIRRDIDAVLWDPGEATGVNGATVNYGGIRFGLPSASAWTSSVTIRGDDFAYSTNSTGLIEAYSATGSGDAGADQIGVEPWSTVTLIGTGSGIWTQVSGVPVVMGGTGATRTFTAPPSMSGNTLVFDFGGDQTTIEVLPATEAIYSGGQWVPVRFIRHS